MGPVRDYQKKKRKLQERNGKRKISPHQAREREKKRIKSHKKEKSTILNKIYTRGRNRKDHAEKYLRQRDIYEKRSLNCARTKQTTLQLGHKYPRPSNKRYGCKCYANPQTCNKESQAKTEGQCGTLQDPILFEQSHKIKRCGWRIQDNYHRRYTLTVI